ncbi:molybdopterin molybdotransferase MoeA [Pseudonocardia sp.]|uniref:molybdopterin molybdotransferase MoeA n=1 Tax=Pseudonocardia sp. TaxID=60912 RepID=UPI003D0A550E
MTVVDVAAAGDTVRPTGHRCGGRSARRVAEHAALAAALLAPPEGLTVPLRACLGRQLVAPVRARRDMPAFDNSAMDGYALRFTDLGPTGLPVAGHIPAGAPLGTLVPGTAQRIMTGAPLPAGADTVVPVELTDNGRRHVRVDGPIEAGRHIRRRGEDVRAGETVLSAGIRLGPQHLAAAAACGVGELHVRRPLRVAVLSAGSELVGVGEDVRPGQTYDSNGTLLVAALGGCGVDVEPLPLVTDRPEDLAALLARRLDHFDLLVTSGGISAGDHEVVREVLAPGGVDFTAVGLKPGGAQGVGRYHGIPVIALPGNPLACWVGFELFVRPAISALCGVPGRPRLTARSSVALRAAPGRVTVVPSTLDVAAGVVSPVRTVGSHSFRALSAADCFVELDATGVAIAAGDVVPVRRVV